MRALFQDAFHETGDPVAGVVLARVGDEEVVSHRSFDYLSLRRRPHERIRPVGEMRTHDLPGPDNGRHGEPPSSWLGYRALLVSTNQTKLALSKRPAVVW